MAFIGTCVALKDTNPTCYISIILYIKAILKLFYKTYKYIESI